jgi:hypothetical protein
MMLRLKYDTARRLELVNHIVVLKLIGEDWMLIDPGAEPIDIINEPNLVRQLLEFCVGGDVLIFTV